MRVRSLRTGQPIINRMMPDPEPLKTVGLLPGKCAIVEANPRRVEHANLLESDGRVPGVRLEQRKIFVRECADVVRKLAVVKPEIRVGEVLQSGVQRPAS